MAVAFVGGPRDGETMTLPTDDLGDRLVLPFDCGSEKRWAAYVRGETDKRGLSEYMFEFEVEEPDA